MIIALLGGAAGATGGGLFGHAVGGIKHSNDQSIPVKRPHNREGTPKEDGIGFSTKQVSIKSEGKVPKLDDQYKKSDHELTPPEPDYVTKAREYADKYHKALLNRFKSEHEAKSQSAHGPAAHETVVGH
jgi:hypothetical protein